MHRPRAFSFFRLKLMRSRFLCFGSTSFGWAFSFRGGRLALLKAATAALMRSAASEWILSDGFLSAVIQVL